MKSTLFCIFLLSMRLVAQDAAQPAKQVVQPIQWEYTIVTTYYPGVEEEEKLRKLGLEGWELVAVLNGEGLFSKSEDNKPLQKNGPHLRYYFKRQKLHVNREG